MAEMPSLPPTFAPSPTAVAELSLAREALETALVLDAALGDDAAFDRDAAQLAPSYADARGLCPDSVAGEPLCASLMLLRDKAMLAHQTFSFNAWERGAYASNTAQGTRAGGAVGGATAAGAAAAAAAGPAAAAGAPSEAAV